MACALMRDEIFDIFGIMKVSGDEVSHIAHERQ